MDGMECHSENLVLIKSVVHARRLSEGLWDLFRSKNGLDCDFRWDRRRIRAHRIVLQLFLRSDMLDLHPLVKTEVLNEDSADMLDSVLEFMYRGEVSVPEQRLKDLLEMANKLDFQLLVDAVVHFRFTGDSVEESDFDGPPSGPDAMPDEIVFEPILELVEPKSEPLVELEIKEEHEDFISGSSNVVEWSYESEGAIIESSVDFDDDDRTEIYAQNVPHDDFGCESNDSAPQTYDWNKAAQSDRFSETNCGYKAVYKSGAKKQRGTLKSFKCQLCDHVTSWSRQLRVHCEVVHGLGEGRFTCETCGKRCASQGSLNVHNRSHTRERPFPCPHCQFAATQKSDLKRHMELLHFGPSTSKAPTSTYSATESDNTHTVGVSIEPISDPYCQLASSNIEDYHENQEWVNGTNSKDEHISRYKCNLCDYESIRRNNMNRHVVIKHNFSKPFQCPHCSRACSLKQNLKRHIQRVHGFDLHLPATKRSKKSNVVNAVVWPEADCNIGETL